MPLSPESLDPDPISQLATWLTEADEAGLPLANAFALATSGEDGSPSVRMVLLRGLDADGLRFYTDRRSRKGRDLLANPRAAAAFWWPTLDRQARASGPITALSAAESSAYWRSRPRGAQLSASVSQQGEEIASRQELERRVSELGAHLGSAEIPLPDFWGGYLLRPESIEFWESRPDRLHDRVEFRRGADGAWRRRRLQP